MRRATSLLLAASLAMTGAVYVFGPSLSGAARINGGAIASETPASTLTEAEVLDIVSDSGELLRANEDAYAASFNATGFSADGGTGGYVWGCGGPNCKYKLAEGSQMEMTATANQLTFNVGMVNLPTTTIQAGSCPSGASCYMFADNGQWFYLFPSADVSGCAANREGGLRAYSTDKTLRYCDGTAARRVTVDSLVTLPTCGASTEGMARVDGASGGTSGARTRLCLCTSDGAGTPAYAWQNVESGTVGTTTTCSP